MVEASHVCLESDFVGIRIPVLERFDVPRHHEIETKKFNFVDQFFYGRRLIAISAGVHNALVMRSPHQQRSIHQVSFKVHHHHVLVIGNGPHRVGGAR
jgi:hypothetical protein